MKYVRYIFLALLISILLINGCIEVLAANKGFSTEILSEENINTFIQNVNISILPDEPPKRAIECFDVNEDGLIAIGCSNFKNKTVCIYTQDGDFKYGYSFNCSGTFGVELNKTVLNIYFVRSDIALAVNLEGEIESILKIKNTLENNSYWNNCVFSTKRKFGDTEYIIKNDMGIFNLFASSYSQLLISNPNGENSIIYDVNSMQLTKSIVTISLICVFVFVAVAVVIWQFIKLRRGN